MEVRKMVSGCILLLSACTTTQGIRLQVIERSDDKPSWASLMRSSYRDGDMMKFVGYFTADGDARPSAVVHGAGVKASAMPLQSISDDFLQQSGVAEDSRGSSSELTISTLRRNPPAIPGLQVVGSYYERVEIQSFDGSQRTEIRAYSLAECPVGEYNHAKSEALARLNGDPKIKLRLDKLMAEQRNRVYGDRKPSSVDAGSVRQPEEVSVAPSVE